MFHSFFYGIKKIFRNQPNILYGSIIATSRRPEKKTHQILEKKEK